jgi:hypothetical protein
MLIKEIIAVYSNNHMKSYELLTAKEGGAQSYHWALKS